MYDLEESAIQKIEIAKQLCHKEPMTLISQQCIGGVIYHDMGMKFLSPTINLYFPAKDFIKFVKNIKYYVELPLKIVEEEPIVGYLEDVKMVFLHYTSAKEAKEKWEERRKRILWEKIFVIATDRDGFDEECFQEFKKLPYPKALITRNPNWKEEFVIYLKEYQNQECIPDIIPKREFYEENKIIELINRL